MRMLLSFNPWIASKGRVSLATLLSWERDMLSVDIAQLVFRICFVLSWRFLILLYYDFLLYTNSCLTAPL